ncbi:hypothetical protein LRS10_22670 [Phenylobacterium sp. J426]|uniref:hypothetical protein n=1 Tax=Phenylobacterium sp. J426 TaxID=2898439 RepID=UPI0021517F47|nr:hypothetical protein [Phenylobacterium sp. J426]MCR5876712.1 hypothetical protein [Phenylobacterium sp. J426]
MPRWMIWSWRLALGAVLLVAFVGATDANERWAALQLKPDQVNHGLLSFGLTFLLLASFRRAKTWQVAAVVLGAGFGLEGLQALGYFAGDAQMKDLVSDVVGVAFAALPVAVGRSQGRRAAQEEAPSSQPGTGSATPL